MAEIKHFAYLQTIEALSQFFMPPKKPWQTLSSRTVYKNKWIRVREDQVIRPNGQRGTYGVVESSPSIWIIALTTKKEIYLVRQYRYPTKVWSWEIPSGGSDGQPLLAAAKRELWEETGLKAKYWTSIGKFQSANGISNQWCYVFIAKGLKQTNSHKQKDEGITGLAVIPFTDAFKMIKQKKITDGLSVAALMKAALHLKLIND